jgi:CheY-like chemotaxis protein
METDPQTGDPRYLLLVEDDPANRTLLERVAAMVDPPYQIVAVSRGYAALTIARRQRPAVIVLDLGLPDITGPDVLTMLRRDPATKAIPVVVVTGDARPERERELLEAGATAFLVKPVDLQQLRDVLGRVSHEEHAAS